MSGEERNAKARRVFPKEVDVHYLDQVAEQGFETFQACLINEKVILQVARKSQGTVGRFLHQLVDIRCNQLSDNIE
ncbi:hypothetical protein CIG75_00780 [Tumebacillus algifaecis]|uniref:Uncharacterized protein n=1 Tax=Tumebacillus algifaecis TaxID=1214604 RepID=A0A223CWY8_9BACL|nr:hypothetical protein CIG75_00780 [Tumebacillus algifaecis]